MVRNTTHTQTPVTLSTYSITKTSIGGPLPPENVKLKHRLTQCLFLLYGVNLRLQYSISIIQYNDTVRSYSQPILLLTIYLRTYTIVLLIFPNGWTSIPVIFTEGLRSARHRYATEFSGDPFTYPPVSYVHYQVPQTTKSLRTYSPTVLHEAHLCDVVPHITISSD